MPGGVGRSAFFPRGERRRNRRPVRQHFPDRGVVDMRILFAVTCLALALAVTTSAPPGASAQGEPKYTISQVMKKAHSGKGLLSKVTSGQATDAEGKELLAMYQSIAKNKPP